ncbi:lasso peptide biosynthesis PqqD family chaperone [Streptomyces endophytica]|uniref:Lasso peptide biosynthesis PqqD family chaperone n=1 Tax=Streptomyces endophytica TaxID=2991496 RepID=A0ABY6PCT1_9ACTN|nr:lasso peptide biosynthesis PqqD family chaperone [Streptomyces endophytica]UZJ31165.1 lasso peptide biosynthesis PqqD family chaperone [Streptomyces endophytica]
MTLALAPHVTSTRTADGTVLLDTRTGRYWQMNATATLVLDHLLAGGTCRTAAAALRARHPSAGHHAEPDARALLDSRSPPGW